MPGADGVKVIDFEPGLVSGPKPVPSGLSTLAPVSVSPAPAANVAVICALCPTCMLAASVAIVAVGCGAGLTRTGVWGGGFPPAPPPPAGGGREESDTTQT